MANQKHASTATDLYAGLDANSQRMVLWLFEREVAEQSRFALRAAADMNALLQAPMHLDHDRFWAAVQLFLTGAANVSKLLWPSAGRPTAGSWRDRGAMLRASLNVQAGSALEQRTFRNSFEHFDERLETWLVSSPNRNIVDRNISPKGAIVGFQDADHLRGFDPSTWSITFNGQPHNSAAVLQELAALYQTATTLTAQPWWETP